MNASRNLAEKSIVTDAGSEELTYETALTWFSRDELAAWWEYMIEQVAEEGLWLGIELDEMESSDAPLVVHVNVAKAIFQKHKWFQFTSLHNGPPFREEPESHAIRLGVKLRHFLGQPDLEIINDNKPAVKLLRKELDGIRWQRRSAVRVAHNLKREDATEILGPDTPWKHPHRQRS